MVCSVDLLSLLPGRCHPQALGHLLHWPCGGTSAGCATYFPFGSSVVTLGFSLFVAVVLATPGSLFLSCRDVSSSAAASHSFFYL